MAAGHGHGNSLQWVDAEQVEGPASELAGLAGDGDGGLIPGEQPDPVEYEVGQVR